MFQDARMHRRTHRRTVQKQYASGHTDIVLFVIIIIIYVKKLHSLYELCNGDFVVGDIKLQRSPLQNSNFVITHCQ